MKHLEHLRQCLASFAEAGPVLHGWGLSDLSRGWRNLTALAQVLPLHVLHDLTTPLGLILPTCPVPDLALNNLERFLASPGGPATLPALLENRGRLLETLLHLLATSDSFADLLARNADYLDMLRVPLSSSPGPEELVRDLRESVAAAGDEAGVLAAFRRFRQRHLLRIGTNDIIRDRPLEEVTRDLSFVADAALEVALETAWRTVASRFGEPLTTEGQPARGVLLALGKHGGQELNYSSDLDLMFVYDAEGATQGGRASLGNDEFFARVVGELVRLLSTITDRGQAYRIDLRLRPEGERGPLARSLASTLAYYDTLGRTWERQALIKVRPAAGDRALGERFLQGIDPFVWRRYLTFAEINEIKALKRQIEAQAHKAGVSDREVKTGRGGIRDIEFTLQFLQLLNGGDLPGLRQRNTLAALVALEQVGCLTDQEFRVLEDAYRFLRKTEHRLQLLFDLATHELPAREEELTRLASRMGYRDASVFLSDYRGKTEPTRRILDHLLHDSFSTDQGETSPESDLILDPKPDPETIRTVLGRYPFRDIPAAYQNLTQLAQESVPFLSTRRCRQFLASIAPNLLRAVTETGDPDFALLNLEKVTHSLGGKTVLYELFSFNRPSLKLYVELCAWSQFLSEILINNPGLIDELLDSLVLNQPRSLADLRGELTDLCRGAEDLDPILHSFQDKELLRIGVRDILGKDPIRETTAALSDLAEAILEQVSLAQLKPLEQRYGEPILTEGPRAGQRCRFVLLGLGKLGGQEMSYHSDLDLVLIYEGEGRAEKHQAGGRREPRETLVFFTDLAQRIIKAMNTSGPLGRLYEVDMRLRPTGKSGSLVVPLAEFRRYYLESGAHLWERQALTRARIVHGDAEFGREVMATVEQAVAGRPWRSRWAGEILEMRRKLETSRADGDLKRGPGGLMDIEFLVQLFQLKYGTSIPYLRTPNTGRALAAAEAARRLSPEEAADLSRAYDFLSRVQSRLRIVHNRSLDRVPDQPEEIAKLARRLGFDDGPPFQAALEMHLTRTRQRFLTILERERDMGFEEM
jgi:glutamate-ammonia-ligase adenylyltransferase